MAITAHMVSAIGVGYTSYWICFLVFNLFRRLLLSVFDQVLNVHFIIQFSAVHANFLQTDFQCLKEKVSIVIANKCRPIHLSIYKVKYLDYYWLNWLSILTTFLQNLKVN